ncbi:Toxin higB-1 [Yersinia frederiksenii]|uniref:type II toxin-antitoxin system RelE/ParE family toxin n=1 Tax=Yersinia alsatica TaxID=2890317 RepID=UPI0005DB9914|nr:type II toxin-antitoxin system RelE/ParE family toxin [Yersinia alsatica]CFQ63833.1 Toxin higB-1 [Yersinia frederiksenii]CND43087.1 Toxin higB-1 [Yersinia frederiksenii]CNI00789.1 Toxin higB-1 [Yersinia frederiksenii]CNI59602.1 Toxin higB-1 [Yersinia frederiksenii]
MDKHKKRSIGSFRDTWLEGFFEHGGRHRKIPASIENVLARKLDIINAAISYKDLRSPPANRYEELNPPLGGYSSIRINDQYRLIFVWANGKANDLYLDAHGYKKHR